MSAATIVFVDVVGFSKKPTADQRRLVNQLNAEVIHEIRPLLSPPIGLPSVIALPTGDGMALALLHETERSWDRATILGLTMRLHLWAYSEKRSPGGVMLRIGIHVGAVELVTDINGRPNVCGDSINYCQRVMDSASPCQTLFSESAFREYVGCETSVSLPPPFNDQFGANIEGPIEVYAKHGLQIQVYKMTVEPSQDWYSNDDPIAKHLMLVTLTALPKAISGSFGDRLQRSTSIALIQLTGDRLLENLETEKLQLSKGLKRFSVFMPAPDTCQALHIPSNATGTEQVNSEIVGESVEKWKKYLAKLRTAVSGADIKLGVFCAPFYFGASFLDWERPGGRIHVSPCLWGMNAPEWPGYDLDWIGSTPSPVFEKYVEGLQYINAQTSNGV